MSQPLTPSRLEAFSDGVIAVIITIMVLDLKVPGHEFSNIAALRQDIPLVLVYLLSFIQVGIYWVNHHYLIDDVEQVTHGILWSNLALLFTLSLMPFAAKWVAERGISPFSVALYAVISALPALTWIILASIVCRRSNQPLAGCPTQQAISATLYLGAITMAYVSPYIALAMLVTVAIRWTLPPKKIKELTRSTTPPAPNAHTR